MHASSFRWAAAASTALSLAVDLFQTPVPAAVLARLGAAASAQDLSLLAATTAAQTSLARSLVNLRSLSLPGRWVMVRKSLFPPRRAVAERLGVPDTPCVWLRYPALWYRLAHLLRTALSPPRRAALATAAAVEAADALWQRWETPPQGGPP